MKIKTNELTGHALDWAVAKAAGFEPQVRPTGIYAKGWPHSGCPHCPQRIHPSTDWSQGGPIIERERIITIPQSDLGGNALPIWTASYSLSYTSKSIAGPTPLIAAMRCYVASRLGEAVYIPEELLK